MALPVLNSLRFRTAGTPWPGVDSAAPLTTGAVILKEINLL